jgi:hypothetical protein
MPDRSLPDANVFDARGQWSQRLAGLPLETPPPDGWQRLSARLETADPASTATAPHRRWPWWMASAAVLALAVALPWQLRGPGDATDASPASTPSTDASPASPSLEQLYAQSAQLEAVLRVASDDRVASATAAALAGELETRLATIDAALMQPELSPEQQRSLWQQRVDDLRLLTGFESQQRWLSSQGSALDAALVYVD